MWPSWVVNATGESTSCIFMRKAGTHTTSSMDDTIHVYMSNLSLISQILFQLTSFPARRKCLRAAIAHGYLIFARAPERGATVLQADGVITIHIQTVKECPGLADCFFSAA